MKIYLVGGAVRDELLGKEPRDKDYVVVDSSEEEMLSLGLERIGKSFPVFQDPETKEEYALARRESKTSKGHQGFEFQWEGVSLEEDLKRRDYTINAIAKDIQTGELTDPYKGAEDIRNGVLKHVSGQFSEDPLRVLRGARFLAQNPSLELAEETFGKWVEVVSSGELRELSSERIWKEIEKALLSESPTRFFEHLLSCGALEVFLPELARLHGVPQPEKYHPEGCCWTHTMLVLENACKLSKKLEVRFAALVHDLGKGVTPEDVLPSHHGHEEAGVPLVESVCDRFSVTKNIRKTALAATRQHLRVHRSLESKPGKLLSLIESLGHNSNPNLFENVLIVCEADNLGKENEGYEQSRFLRNVSGVVKELDLSHLPEKYEGPKIPGVAKQYKTEAIGEFLREGLLQQNKERE